VGVACALLAGLEWVGPHVLGPFRDAAVAGDGNPVPPHHRNYHDGWVHLLLGCAGAAAVLAVAGFVVIAVMRSNSRHSRRW
jgi:hypothetical protein